MDTDACFWLTMIDMTLVKSNGTSQYLGARTHRSMKLRAKYVN